ncbi:MAG: hypothetical protein BJ554DRAFT_8373, partial [Olpidium bornovanus]
RPPQHDATGHDRERPRRRPPGQGPAGWRRIGAAGHRVTAGCLGRTSPPPNRGIPEATVPLSNDFVRRKNKSPGKAGGPNVPSRASAHLIRDAAGLPEGVLPKISDRGAEKGYASQRRKSPRSRSPVRFAQAADGKDEAPYITASELLPRLHQSGRSPVFSTRSGEPGQDDAAITRQREKASLGQPKSGQPQEANPAVRSGGSVRERQALSETDGAIEEFERRHFRAGDMLDEEAETCDSWHVELSAARDAVPDEQRRLAMAREVKKAIAEFEKRNAKFAFSPSSDTDEESEAGEADVPAKNVIPPAQIKSFLAVQAGMDSM